MVMSDDDTVETNQALYGEAKLGLSDKTVATFNLRHDRLGVRFNACRWRAAATARWLSARIST